MVIRERARPNRYPQHARAATESRPQRTVAPDTPAAACGPSMAAQGERTSRPPAGVNWPVVATTRTGRQVNRAPYHVNRRCGQAYWPPAAPAIKSQGHRRDLRPDDGEMDMAASVAPSNASQPGSTEQAANDGWPPRRAYVTDKARRSHGWPLPVLRRPQAPYGRSDGLERHLGKATPALTSGSGGRAERAGRPTRSPPTLPASRPC